MSVPNEQARVQAIADEGYFVKVAQGDHRAAGLFARYVAYRLNPTGDPSSWGWLTKSSGESNVDGYAEDAIVYGSHPSNLFNVVDLIAGAGAPGASVSWAVQPRRPSNTWEAPRPLSTADMAYLRNGQPVPTPTPTPPPSPPPQYGEILAAITDLRGRFAQLHSQQVVILNEIAALRRDGHGLHDQLAIANARLSEAILLVRDVRAALSNGLHVEAQADLRGWGSSRGPIVGKAHG